MRNKVLSYGVSQQTYMGLKAITYIMAASYKSLRKTMVV